MERPGVGRSRSPAGGRAEAGGRPRGGRKWPGCYVAHGEAPWILGLEDLSSAGLEGELPDISIDPEGRVLSVINSTERERCYFLSVPARCRCVGAAGRRLQPGAARSADGDESAVVAFTLVVGPHKVMDVCELRGAGAVRAAREGLQSDIVDLAPPPPAVPAGGGFPGQHVYGFPLGGPGPYLCSQASGGRLTHFAHPSTYHAVDLDCAVGTPVLAICSGTVQEVQDSERVSGIDVRNFFRWNQVTVLQEDGTLAEYVHIAPGSASAAGICVGSQVQRGQKLCCSGDVGFCPRPHLHLEVHLESGRRAPSVPFGFEGAAGPYRCEEGGLYAPDGPAL